MGVGAGVGAGGGASAGALSAGGVLSFGALGAFFFGAATADTDQHATSTIASFFT
jgi:hypothetical protein